jgi:hypothetical protein
MRKRITSEPITTADTADAQQWLDLDSLIRVELTSEDPLYPIEAAFMDNAGFYGWRAMDAGAQTVRLLFDTPHRIRRICLLFQDIETERTQEFVLRWRSATDPHSREIVRQQYTFSPPYTTEEREDYSVDLDALTELELCIVPEISGGPARASLAQLRLA